MRVKQMETKSGKAIKMEDTDSPLSLNSVPVKGESLPGSGDPTLLKDEAPEDVSLQTNDGKRVRYFMDAIVITKLSPEAHLDAHYKDASTLFAFSSSGSGRRTSARVKKEASPSIPATRSGGKGTQKKSLRQKSKAAKRPSVKTETEDFFQPVPATIGVDDLCSLDHPHILHENPSPSSVKGQRRSQSSRGDRGGLAVKIREESPDVSLGTGSTQAPSVSDSQESTEEAMKKWKNPKAKVKKEAATLCGDTVRARLTEAGISMGVVPIDCDKEILDTMVSREFMSKWWGGSMQETFPKIGKAKFAEHGLDDFMYLPDDFQPIAPQVPGAPGIWINEGSDDGEWSESSSIMRVFSRIRTGPALEEWDQQDPAVRIKWAQGIYKKGWGTDVRVNIYSRREYGRLPTKAQYEDIITRKLYNEIKPHHISMALKSGEETMALYTMKCVGYDKAFAKLVHERWQSWVPTVRKKRKAAGEVKTEQGQKRRTKKQKLEDDVIIVDDLHSDDDDGLSEEEFGEDEPESEAEEGPQELVYRPRGTRTRPRM
ncbi:hypothetical protein NMY22_g357 [Coprinellus aureogranulatus]|nr:hypothetical protein NMY22_g357 [Coprinellus aureogranulatus]